MSFFASKSSRTYALLALAGVIIVGSGYLLFRPASPAAFYYGQLASAGLKDLSPTSPVTALRTAYARELARRDPILGLAGTDPEKLLKETGVLATTLKRLEAFQKSASDKQAIKALYPVDFLRSVAQAEVARRAFINSGSEVDRATYDAALITAAAAGSRDAKNFTTALYPYNKELGTASLVSVGGSMTADRINAVASSTESRFIVITERIARRERCLSFDIGSCDKTGLRMELPQPTDVTVSAETLATAREIQNLYARVSGRPSDRTIIALPSSICVAQLHAPYLFTVQDSGISAVNFVGDMIFRTTEATGAVNDFFVNKYRLELQYVNPMQPYQCPDLALDLSAVLAVERTVKFAQAHPEVALSKRAPLLGTGPVSQGDAVRYVEAALREVKKNALTIKEQNELFEILLMSKDHAAGLDSVVATIASAYAQYERLNNIGAQFSLSAKFLYLTHSAFPTLFMLQSQGGGLQPITLQDGHHGPTRSFLEVTKRYANADNTERKEMAQAFKTLTTIMNPTAKPQ